MRKKIRKIYLRLRIELHILRLHFVRMPEPEDAKTPEQMLEEIKRRVSELT